MEDLAAINQNMRKEYPDTNGLLDKCLECNARAKFIISNGKYSVECSECPNTIGEFHEGFDLAMTHWNQEQRKKLTT